jgi:PAS domain-containing protein
MAHVGEDHRSRERSEGDDAGVRENDFLRALLDQLAEGVVVRRTGVDRLLVNRVARDLLGLTDANPTTGQ